MPHKIMIDEKEYEVENLSEQTKAVLASLQFTSRRITELTNMERILSRAKIGYLTAIKDEMNSEAFNSSIDER